jgi:hypothetical protein
MASGSVQIMMWLSNVFCGTGYRAHLPSQPFLKGNKMRHFYSVMEFDQWVMDVADNICPDADNIEMFNGTLFIAGCTARQAAKLESAIINHGMNVIVTPGNEYSFDFVPS